MITIARYEVTDGNGRSFKEIIEQEVLMVQNNKWLTDKEKAAQVKKLERLIRNSNENRND